MCPVVRLKYVTADLVEIFKYNKNVMDIVKSMGPELLPHPASIHPFFNNIHSILEIS